MTAEIISKLHALGLHNISEALTRERLEFLSTIAELGRKFQDLANMILEADLPEDHSLRIAAACALND